MFIDMMDSDKTTINTDHIIEMYLDPSNAIACIFVGGAKETYLYDSLERATTMFYKLKRVIKTLEL